MDSVLINFHTASYGCINIYAKCSESVAKQFIDNIAVLHEYVMLWAVNGWSCRDMLKDVIQIKITDKIVVHNYKKCPLFNEDLDDFYAGYKIEIRNEDKSRWDNDDHEEDMFFPDIYSSTETDLFESIMLYSIMQTIHEILNLNTLVKCKHDITNKISLYTNHKLILEIDVPDMMGNSPTKGDLYDKDPYPWIEPLNRNDINLIKTINDLVQILKYTKKFKQIEKILVFSGYDINKPSKKKSKEKSKAKGKGKSKEKNLNNESKN
jgi:hypothetical protein